MTTHSTKRTHPRSPRRSRRTNHQRPAPPPQRWKFYGLIAGCAVLIAGAIILLPPFFGGSPASRHEQAALPLSRQVPATSTAAPDTAALRDEPHELWLARAYRIDKSFHRVYTPNWQGAYGALGDAYLFAATHDSALLRFHMVEHPLTSLSNANWVDSRAWACLAELTWWEFTGKTDVQLVADAKRRYDEARRAGMLSNHEGYWTWYNLPPRVQVNTPIFTNTNMNQMVNVACRLYQATHDGQYLKDALQAWNGNASAPGIEKRLYQGKGVWKGREGKAASGKELPWGGTGYCSIGAALYRATQDVHYKQLVVETARRMMDPATGWVDPVDFYQIHMDGNGAFVHFLMDAYAIAPDELHDIPAKVERMLEHVWSNHHGTARMVLHREQDDGIRNGWNPNGGEDGFLVDEIGTVHAQGEAVRAFGVFAYYKHAAMAAAGGATKKAGSGKTTARVDKGR